MKKNENPATWFNDEIKKIERNDVFICEGILLNITEKIYIYITSVLGWKKKRVTKFMKKFEKCNKKGKQVIQLRKLCKLLDKIGLEMNIEINKK